MYQTQKFQSLVPINEISHILEVEGQNWGSGIITHPLYIQWVFVPCKLVQVEGSVDKNIPLLLTYIIVVLLTGFFEIFWMFYA